MAQASAKSVEGDFLFHLFQRPAESAVTRDLLIGNNRSRMIAAGTAESQPDSGMCLALDPAELHRV
jgi:hypothetical protein